MDGRFEQPNWEGRLRRGSHQLWPPYPTFYGLASGTVILLAQMICVLDNCGQSKRPGECAEAVADNARAGAQWLPDQVGLGRPSVF